MVRNSAADGSYFFRESACDSEDPYAFGRSHRSAPYHFFENGDGASVEMIIGLAQGHDLIRTMRERLRDCPRGGRQGFPQPVTALDVPDFGLEVAALRYTGGLAFQPDAHAVAVYGDVTAEINLRKTSAADTTRILTAWLSRLISVHHSPTLMGSALLTGPELPTGYTRVLGGEDWWPDIHMYGSELCGGDGKRIQGPLTRAWQQFENRNGATLEIEVAALGSARARRIVERLAAVPERCRSHGDPDGSAQHHRLALPNLGGPAAGVVTVGTPSGQDRERRHSVALVRGDVLVTFDERGPNDIDLPRFLRIVKAGAAKVSVIGKP
jgi:hypothetical protein